MRLAGVLTVIASLMAAAIFCLLPAADGCDTPVGTVASKVLDRDDPDDLFEQLTAEECYDQSLSRVLIAGALLAIGGGGGAGLIAVGWPSREEHPA